LEPELGVTEGHRNRHGSIRHLWLPISVSMQRRAYLVPFSIQTAISVENRNVFFIPMFFATRWWGSPWNWVPALEVKN